ncbi:L-lactate permease [Candidatus Hepatincola sp. Pdp]
MLLDFTLSVLPIISILIFVAILGIKPKYALLISNIYTVFIVYKHWHLSILTISAVSFLGFLNMINIMLIVFGALLVLNLLKEVGAMNVMISAFYHISADRRIQTIVIALFFSAFLDGAASFGTSAALAAFMLVILGFPPILAALVSLLYNGGQVSFGAVGLPSTTILQLTKSQVAALGLNPQQYEQTFNLYTPLFLSFVLLIISIIAMFIVTRYSANPDNKNKEFFEILPFTIFSTLIVAVIYVITSVYVSIELPSLIAGLIGTPIIIAIVKSGFLIPENTFSFPNKAKWSDSWKASAKPHLDHNTVMKSNKVSAFKAWLPYTIIAILLLITRIDFFGLKTLLNIPKISYLNIFGVPNINFSWNYAYNPGLIPFIVIAIFISLYFKLNMKKTLSVWNFTLNQIAETTITVTLAMVLMSILMATNNNSVGLTGMLPMIAKGLVDSTGNFYIFISPLIGMLGSFISGSNTLSNTLFVNVQMSASYLLHINPAIMASLQNVAGAIGIIFTLKSVVIVSATISLKNKEVYLVKVGLLAAIICSVLLSLLVWFIVF